MLVSETVYQSESGERKQLTMDGWAADALKRNPEMTKGLTAYECLLLADDSFEDKLTRIENRVVDELAAETGDDVRDALDDLVESRIVDARERLVDACEYHDPWEDVYPVELYVVSDVDEELPRRGASSVIEDAIAWTAASPWSSRLERLSDLQGLVSVARNEGAPSDASDFVRAVESGESDRWDVDRLHSIISPEVEFWERSDLTMGDLADKATDIAQSPNKRSTALETALSNSEEVIDEVKAENYAEYYFDDVKDNAARGYAEMVDINATNKDTTTVRLNIGDLIEEIYEDTLGGEGSIQKTRKIESLDDYSVAGFDEDPRGHGGLYRPTDVSDQVDNILELINENQHGLAADNADKVRAWCAEKEREAEELLED